MHLQDPRHVTGTHDKITIHTPCTYKSRDMSPVHMTKLQYTIHTAFIYKTRDRSPVHITKITMYTACIYNRSPVHMTKSQYTQHSPTRPEQGYQYTLPYSTKLWRSKTLADWHLKCIWRKKHWRIEYYNDIEN